MQFDPHHPNFISNPWPIFKYLRENHPIYYHEGLKDWMITRYRDAMPLLKDARLSHNFYYWEYAPPARPIAQQSEFERLMASATFQLNKEDHQRIRKLVLPAFSPRVMDEMKITLKNLCNQLFDEVGTNEIFNFAESVNMGFA